MTPADHRPKPLSTAERQRQNEESVALAMDRYKREGEAVRANTERLKALREAHQRANPVAVPERRRRRTKA